VRYLLRPSVPFSPYSAVKFSHCMQPSMSVDGFTPPSMRSPEIVTPTGTPTGPPPSDAGHVSLPGSVFISVMAHTFLV
jgi:hypothetical protein